MAGTAAAGSTVEVFDGATQIGTAAANGSGAWSFATATLADGSHAFTTKAMDAAGNLSTASAALTVTVDTVAPGAPTVASFSPDSGTAGDGITNANHITLTGTAAAGSTVEVFDGATQIGTAMANGSGAWSFATATLADGSHAFTTKAMDAAGNLSTASAALNVTVDTVAPGAPTIVSDSTGVTNSVDVSGTAEAGSKVSLYEGTALLSTGVANSSGNWTINTGTLSAGAHDFTATATDAAGNISALSADFDPVVGVTIESQGSTSLVQTGNNYFLNPVAGGTGPELKYLGTPWTDGEWGSWTPIGAEATATGYEVAFKTGTDTYTVWNTDANGNLTANPIGTVSGSSLTLEALETSFHQDLNGDGTIGLPPTETMIESFGSTSLVQTGSNFVFDRGGSGPELHYDGAAFVAGQWGGWTPIGVEATATGYEVAFKVTGADQYTVWDTDPNGNIIIDPIGTVSGSSTTLIALERSFQQDLNGDGMVGNPSIPIPVESFGSTSLVQTGNDYFLYANGTSSGPALKYGGAPWTDGEWGGWTPIGAEVTATGYEVAFNLAGTNQYTVWNTDSNGNITTDTIGTVTGNSAALVALETGFHQDLNGDGIIGDPSIPFAIETSGSTSLTQLGHNFFLYANGTSNGPELKDSGAPWAIGQWGGWTPIGVEATAAGYEVAFKLTGSDLYTVWNTDSNGNITTNPISSVSGSDSSLQSIETSFHQDLNGDGVIDTASTVIEASGSLKVGLTHVVQPSAIDAGSTLELTGTASGSVTFKAASGMLVLDQATQFTGSIIGLAGDGTAAHSDQIDLKDISYGAGTTQSFSGNAAGGVLTVTDAQGHAAHLSLVGNYTNSIFNLSSDGNGGTMVIDPPKDGFEFAPTSPPIGASPSSAPTAQITNDGFAFVDGANAMGGAESPEHQLSVVGLVDAADHFFHQVWTEVSHEFAASPLVLDNHSLLAELHHFMLH